MALASWWVGSPRKGANSPALHLPGVGSSRGHPQAARDQPVHCRDGAHVTCPRPFLLGAPLRGPLPSSVLQKGVLLFWGAPVAEGPDPNSPLSNNE